MSAKLFKARISVLIQSHPTDKKVMAHFKEKLFIGSSKLEFLAAIEDNMLFLKYNFVILI